MELWKIPEQILDAVKWVIIISAIGWWGLYFLKEFINFFLDSTKGKK